MSDTISVSFEVVKPLPTQKISNWEDKVVFGMARATLDYTNSKHNFPYLTGALNRASMSEGVVKEKKGTYHIGAKGTDYAKYVWNFGANTNWTNKSTLPQWYSTVYKRYRESIIENAINQAKGELK